MLKKQEGFTLIEMLIVLMIITVLIILIVPSLANRTKEVNAKGCDALQKSVQAQVNVYQLEENKLPDTLQDLVDRTYITTQQTTCRDGTQLTPSNGIISTTRWLHSQTKLALPYSDYFLF